MRRVAFTFFFFFAALLGAGETSVLAAPLTVDYFDSVTGWEWADLTQTRNLSWNTVAAVCPQDGITPCSGNIGALEFTGWIWATKDHVRDLFVNATDLTAAQMADYFEQATDSTWAPQFLSLFAETTPGEVYAYTAEKTGGFPIIPWLGNAPPTGTDRVRVDGTGSDAGFAYVGVWLHRSDVTAVPEPASLLLVATGIAGAAVRRYRRKS